MEETMAGCQRLAFKDIHNFIMSLVGEDLHAKRVYSLAITVQRGVINYVGKMLPYPISYEQFVTPDELTRG
jgi:hypothetical protein